MDRAQRDQDAEPLDGLLLVSAAHGFLVGSVVHGFAAGSFGRDSYDCRRVEAVGADWIVTRNRRGEVEMVSGTDIPTTEEAASRVDCPDHCEMA